MLGPGFPLHLDLLAAGELWQPLDEEEYRGVLIETLDDIEVVLSGEEYWREDDQW